VDDGNLNHQPRMCEVTTYIGLGSNLDQPAKQLVNAIAALKQLPDSKLISSSSFYNSKALTLDDNNSTPDYLNAVVSLQTKLDPFTLLDELQAIEFSQGRIRTEQRWESRPIDLDILLYDHETIWSERLTIPHPEICHRDFVLQPLLEISPELDIPGKGPAAEYLATCQQTGLKKVNRSQPV